MGHGNSTQMNSTNTKSRVATAMFFIFVAFLVYYFSDPDWDKSYNRTVAGLLLVVGLLSMIPIARSRYASRCVIHTTHIPRTDIQIHPTNSGNAKHHGVVETKL
jgi:hypothetical protein